MDYEILKAEIENDPRGVGYCNTPREVKFSTDGGTVLISEKHGFLIADPVEVKDCTEGGWCELQKIYYIASPSQGSFCLSVAANTHPKLGREDLPPTDEDCDYPEVLKAPACSGVLQVVNCRKPTAEIVKLLNTPSQDFPEEKSIWAKLFKPATFLSFAQFTFGQDVTEDDVERSK